MSILNRVGTSFLVISKGSVLEKNVSDFEIFVDSVCLAQLRSGRKDYATAVLSIDGYNDDSRSLWHIPEVREWFKALHSVRPYAPYFLSPASIQIYFTCLEPFLPGLLPKEYAGKQHHPVVYMVTYAMDQFMDLLHMVLPSKPDLADGVLNEANERVFSALRNLKESKAEPI